jgi:hypothetical protein
MPQTTPAARIFLLSPANCSGERGKLLLRPGAEFALARELQSRAGARLSDVFQFMSGLYFRGKVAYADRFARPPRGLAGAFVITAGAGLLGLDHRVRPEDLRRFSEVPIEPANSLYRRPLERDARGLAKKLGPAGEVVLLGSIATAKYTEILLAVFADRLRFPTAFTGRGDMSRGSLMLRCARAGLEMDYRPVPDAPVHAESTTRRSLSTAGDHVRE